MKNSTTLETMNKPTVYTLLEYRPWGVQYRVFNTRLGAVQEGRNPGYSSPDLIVGYPHAIGVRLREN